MTFQQTVGFQQGFGVVGDFYNDSPQISLTYTLTSVSAAYNVMGRGFSVTSQGIAAAGNTGTAIFAGILTNPKEQASYGSSTNPLAPTLTLPNGTTASLTTMGTVIVAVPTSCAIGDLVVYDNTTGVLTTIAPTAALPSGKSFAYAQVYAFTPTVSSTIQLAVIQLIPTLTIPVAA